MALMFSSSSSCLGLVVPISASNAPVQAVIAQPTAPASILTTRPTISASLSSQMRPHPFLRELRAQSHRNQPKEFALITSPVCVRAQA